MSTVWFHDCAVCHLKLEPDETVVQGVQTVNVTPLGDETKKEVEGPTALVHERHWPPDTTDWRETYRGPLSGIRPG